MSFRLVRALFSLLLVAVCLLPSMVSAMNADFKRVEKLKPGMQSKQGEILLTPRMVVGAFGAPTPEPWDSESLGAYYFQGSRGQVVLLYFRAYDTRRTEKLVKSFWESVDYVEFSIGAINEEEAEELRAWILQKFERAGRDG